MKIGLSLIDISSGLCKLNAGYDCVPTVYIIMCKKGKGCQGGRKDLILRNKYFLPVKFATAKLPLFAGGQQQPEQ